MQIKFTNDDKLGLNKKWIRTIFLVLGLAFSIVALTHIFLIVIKPKDYEELQKYLAITILNNYFSDFYLSSHISY